MATERTVLLVRNGIWELYRANILYAVYCSSFSLHFASKRESERVRGILGKGDCSPAVFGIPKSLCGFQSNHSVNIYSSPDLKQWTLVGDALPFDSRPFGIYFRPKVVWNHLTSKYVLWINRVSYSPPHRWLNITTVDYHHTSLVVATSTSPEGPFRVETERANVLYKDSAGDFTIFLDDEPDGNRTAYIAYDAMESHHRISIEPLRWDYLDSDRSKNSGLISRRFHEAPAMFHRHGFYWLITGHCCCFCSEGSDGRVYVSNHSALGPYSETQMNINRVDGDGALIVNAQQSFIAQIGDQLLWTGDRWKSAPDHLKGHGVYCTVHSPLPHCCPLPFRLFFTLSVFSRFPVLAVVDFQ